MLVSTNLIHNVFNSEHSLTRDNIMSIKLVSFANIDDVFTVKSLQISATDFESILQYIELDSMLDKDSYSNVDIATILESLDDNHDSLRIDNDCNATYSQYIAVFQLFSEIEDSDDELRVIKICADFIYTEIKY